jgi:hypothetical protein
MSSTASIFVLFIIALCAIGYIWFVVNKAKIKGKIGEFEASAILATLSNNKYKVFNNIILPSKYGTSQIDHVVVSIYGIFVIETKNYKGLIYGGENSEKWTKNMWGKKYEFRNPLKQNYGHVKTLQQILKQSMSCFIPIVVFNDSADISVQTDKTVINLFHLRSAITSHKTIMYTQEEVENICNLLRQAAIEDKGANRQHVNMVRSNIYNRQQAINKGACPQCGGRLVFRHGRYGSFFGCSNYPKCRFTLKR